MNSKQKQGFSTFDTLSVIAAVAAVLIVTFPIVGRQIDIQHNELARIETEKLTQDLVEEHLARITPRETERGLASVGPERQNPLGNDPWGQPYLYRVLRNVYGQPTHIAVWSAGPNQTDDTKEINLNPSTVQAKIFVGDDVGHLRTLR